VLDPSLVFESIRTNNNIFNASQIVLKSSSSNKKINEWIHCIVDILQEICGSKKSTCMNFGPSIMYGIMIQHQ